MAHRISPEAETDLDDIWLHLATETRVLETADRVIDMITERFLLLTQHPHLGRHRDDLRAGSEAFPPVPT